MALSAPDENLVHALVRFREASKFHAPTEACLLPLDGASTVEVPQFAFGDRRFVFVRASEEDTPSSIGQLLRARRPESFDEGNVLEIVVGVSGVKGGLSHANAGLGVRVEPLHAALARLLHLPDGWRQAQLNSLEQTLRPVLVKGQSRAVALLARFEDGSTTEAPAWATKYLSWHQRPSKAGKLLYLRAEAGKGKSTTLANLAYSRLSVSTGPLPLFVPLRDLERGAGVSWSGIAERLGVVEADAERLALAVQAGLVLLVLDGLDEVSGRHNPTLVAQVVDLIVKKALTPHALVAISGRTTEGAFIDATKAVDVSLELPNVDEQSFSDFIEIVIDDITPAWETVSQRLPEPLLERPTREGPELPSDGERKQIRDWIRAVFDGLGKDRSLFFVQGLACIGRSRQLHGNKPLIISGKVIETPATFDVCVLAASLACVREQEKIDQIARDFFTPAKQLDLLTLFALLASVGSSSTSLPTPNELAQRVFEVDPTHQNEEFSAILHQMQKHALLYSRRGEGSTGDWKPTFLSEWVRNALLVRAWRDRSRLAAHLNGVDIGRLVASAREAKLAFYDVLPTLEMTPDDRQALLAAVRLGSDSGSPEATANFWSYASASETPLAVGEVPLRTPELTDFSGSEYDGLQFGSGFSGSYLLFNEVEIQNCEFAGSGFNECDFSGARFVGCQFVDADFSGCFGTAVFDSCGFKNCVFTGSRAKREPAWYFIDSRFEGVRVHQALPVMEGAFVKVCIFEDCVVVEPTHTMFDGDALGFDPRRVRGLDPEGTRAKRAPAQQCLRAMLKPFFPSRVGEGRQVQARRYIRSSALGRGLLPAGSPSTKELLQFLEAEGFTSGGRAAHIYAPWSSVVGGGDNTVALRNELIDYMQTGREGPTVRRMLDRIKRSAGWS